MAFDNLHFKLAIPGYFMSNMLFLGGITAFLMKKFIRPWSTKRTLFIGKIHKIFAWILIIFMQIVVSTGIFKYWGLDKKDFAIKVVAIIESVFCIMLIVLEILHQKRLSEQTPFVRDIQGMTESEFNQRIKEGQQLVILDDLVLDVSDF